MLSGYKTILTNGVILTATLITLLTEVSTTLGPALGFSPEVVSAIAVAMGILSLLNIVLRFLTKTPIFTSELYLDEALLGELTVEDVENAILALEDLKLKRKEDETKV